MMNADQERAEFMRTTAEWDDAKLTAWLAARQEFLKYTICEPRNLRHGNNAFFRGPYEWPERIMAGEENARLMRQKPADLVNPNPLANSPYRTTGAAVWDAAFYLPDPKFRTEDLVETSRVPSITGRNAAWINQIQPALGRCGPLGSGGNIVRPQGEWIYDLKTMPGGWDILEAVHVLVHLRADQMLAKEKPSPAIVFPFAATFRRTLAEVITARAFHLPLNLRGHSKNCDSLLPFGLTVAPTVHILAPTMLVPFEGPGALEIDRTLAVVDVGILIEPQPSAFGHGVQAGIEDRWCCMPSLVVITGWETVDVVSHWLMAAYDLSKGSPQFMAMNVYDLLPPEELGAYLALGYRQRGLPSRDDGWMYFDEWMGSDEYMRAFMATPPLPCRLCMDVNRRTEGAPVRPKHYPRIRYGRKDEEWTAYRGDIRKIHKIIETATVQFEGTRFGGTAEARRIRAERRKRHAAKMQELADREWLARVRTKGGPSRITALQEQKYNRLLKRYPDIGRGET